MSKTALILGVGGQDGSFLAELLLEKGYIVHGMVRRSSTNNLERIKHILGDITILHGDLADPGSLRRVINLARPDEIYNEADQDNVPWSFDIPRYSADVTASAVCTILEILRQEFPRVRYFQPLSATMFGGLVGCDNPQDEATPFNPQSPYAVAKCAAYYWVRYYREVHGLFACTAIMYNHDSPRRSEEYLLQKICKSVQRISIAQICHAVGGEEPKKLLLGNLDQLVDIGYAPEFMGGAHSIMQLDKPSDFILGTGQAYSIWQFVQKTFQAVYHSQEPALGIDLVGEDPQYHRADTPVNLIGDITKAKNAFGWNPEYHGTKLIEELLK